VAIKFNRSGAEGLGTTHALARALVESMLSAGIEERQIVAIEAPESLHATTCVARPVAGWTDRPVDFGSGRDQLAAVLDQATAIINVPFLKTHNIAGISCCLKNLSHGLVRHPARFHENHCSPYIADIVSLPQIRAKLRLNIVDALRVVFDGGPQAYADGIWDAGTLLVGADPVAADTLGLDIIESQRSLLGFGPVRSAGADPVHIKEAGKRNLGEARRYHVEVAKIRV